MTTILLAGGGTGGHLMPAIAIGSYTSWRQPEWRCVYVGATRGVEATILPARGLPHHLLPLEPIYRREWWKNARWVTLLPRLLRHIDRVLDEEQPAAVIGTGGYASGPVVWRAASRGIPTGILELDVRPGIATRRLTNRVNAIWVAAPEAVDALPASVRGKTVVTGAPIDAPNRWRQPQARLHFGLTDGKPVVVITGGSQGSLAINRLVAEWLQQGGGANVNVIWSTGRATHAEFAGLHRPPGVQVLPFIDPMADAWAAAWLVVARAGMMTLAEVCAWGLPSILIPLPTAAADHQRYNARAMAAAGASRVFEQRGLTAATLGGAIEALAADGDALFQMGHAASLRGRPEAAVTIADAVVKLAGGNAPAV